MPAEIEAIYGGEARGCGRRILDIECRWAGGFSVGASRNRALALGALGSLQEEMASLGENLAGVVIYHDRDSVYISYLWLEKLLLDERVRVSYAERGARDNPWIEFFWWRFETENGE